VARAVSVAQGHGRHDLAQVKDGLAPCERALDCRYLIDLDMTLIAGGREDLVGQLHKALYAAPDGLDFARKHGVAAYRDYQEQIDAQIDMIYRVYGPAIDRFYNSDH
jgi:hypothetical protein